MKKLSSLATTLTTCALSLSLSLVGCADSGIEDGRNDSFGGAGAKADSGYSACQLSEVLNFVNESNTSVNRLTRAKLSGTVAKSIVAHRVGPDGALGTGDDDLFDDLAELDGVDFVGTVVLDYLVAAILKRCEVDLATRPFINESTFAGYGGGGGERDAVELESAMTVGGITGPKLHEILSSTDNRGRSVFSRIAKSSIMEAFTYSYNIDEMPWDSDSHAAREGLALLPLSIETGRYTPDQGGGEREIDLGTDIMDDIYFDSFDYRLTRSDQILRGRIRWDTADSVRRLLVAAKFGSFVDDNGLKRASKVDVRTEGGRYKDTLETDVMRGQSNWNGTDRPFGPIKEVYSRLNDSNQLPDIGNERDVLVLDPKVHLRSTRSRMHLDLAQQAAVQNFYNNGLRRISEIRDAAQAAIDDGRVTGQTLSNVEDLIAFADGLTDSTVIADRARSALLMVDPGMTVTVANLTFPNQLPASASNLVELEKNRIVAETINTTFHEFADMVDDLDRDISATAGLANEEFVEMFIEWQRSLSNSLLIKRTTNAFLDRWNAIDTGSDRASQIAAFNNFGSQQVADGDNDFEDFQTVTDTVWLNLGRHLEFATTKTNQRQVEGAGSVAMGLWFEQARETYVPASSRPYGNFIIDTMDMTDMFTREEWTGLSADEQKVDAIFDPAKIFHTVLVNEVQIELGNEAPYVERVAELDAKVAAGTATDEDLKILAGAEMVLGEMSDALIYLSDVKKKGVLKRLDDKGAPNSVDWVPAAHSKGTTALLRLGDMD